MPLKLFLFITALVLAQVLGQAGNFPGKKSTWHDYGRFDFKLGDINCRVVTPDKVAHGKPWIWRARFWGHEPQTDLALLAKG